jgi:hypothetical protein
MAEPVVFAVGADLTALRKQLAKVGPIANKTGELAGAALKAGFAAVVGAAGATGLFAKGVLEEGAQFETLSTRLTTLMGSAEDARDRMQELANIGKTTPFELPGIVEAEASLLGFGVDAEKVLPKVLDLSAALGLELSDAAGAVGRAFAGGAGAADVLRERGVLAAIELRTGIKATNMEIGQFREELLTTLEEYEGGSARLAATLDGQVSNLKDSWGDFQRQVADAGFYDASKTAITEINRLLIENEETISAIAQETGRWLKGSLMFAVQTVGDLLVGWKQAELAITSIDGIVLGLNASTNFWLRDLRQGIADLLPAGSSAQKFIQQQADSVEAIGNSYLAQMNIVRQEGDNIKAEITGIESETEAILKRIEESGTGGTVTRKKKNGSPEEDPEVVALQERQNLIDSILQQYRDEEADEAAKAWDDATKLREQQYKDWEEAEEQAAEDRLRVLEEAQARRMAIAQQGADATLAIARAGGSALVDEDQSFAQTMKKQGLQLISDLLMQLAGYFVVKALAYAATGNVPKAALFGAGALVAAAGSGAVSAASANIDTSAEGSEDGETFTQGSRREVAAADASPTDGGLADAAALLSDAARDLMAAARVMAVRTASGGALGRTLQRERSVSGLFSSFQGA